MSESFLHGIELVEIDDGIRAVQTVRTSVIGLIGTAPAADPAAATLTLGVEASDNAITFTADAQGEAGNLIAVILADPAQASQALAVTVSGTVITVSLATDAEGEITSTAALVLAAVNAHADAGALVTAANAGTSDGSGLVAAVEKTFLTGGKDDKYPLDTPVLITSPRHIRGIGTTGTLPMALRGIHAHASPFIVLIRVAVGGDDAATRANVIGGVDPVTGVRTGCDAFLDARDTLRVVPRLLIAPGFTQHKTVADALLVQAERLKAMVIADGPNTTDTAATAYRDLFDNPRLYLIDPWVRVPTTGGGEEEQPASGRVAGLIAQSDNTRGFWWSPSNQVIIGINGAARPVVWAFNDPDTQANYLNEAHVATIIHEQGFRLWGNRTASSDQRWMFFSIRRIADMINESVMMAHLWAVDRNITKTYLEDVTEAVNAYMRRLKNLGAILGGRCYADPELNTPENIMLGRVYFDFDFTAPYPAERITFRSHMVGDYLEEIL